MNFLADESGDQQIVRRLRADGHHVWYVAEMQPGLADIAVLEEADREAALLLTADKDFGELVFRQRRLTTGVVLVRLAGIAPSDKAHLVASAIKQHAAELTHAFTVIAPGAIRVRRWRE